jgi:ATP-dependent exoDNAse (exonuclease V) beta subunit
MSSPTQKLAPPDQAERIRALDPTSSILVQAPAGSGKTDLLTRRFLRLLAEVDEPGQVVAITFTTAAAAEMRHRILGELEKAAASRDISITSDEFSIENLARRALAHSRRRDWKLLDLPAQLRVSTIDSFCRELALQQPLLSSLGGGIGIAGQPNELYRRAARQTLEKIGQEDRLLSEAIEALLRWRDNNWQEMEELLVQMLAVRDRWMHEFVLTGEPDWEALRNRLERPFATAVREALASLDELFDQVPGARDEILALARFACQQVESPFLRELAELAEFPETDFLSSDSLEEACEVYVHLAKLLLTGDGAFRKQVDKRLGFPSDRKSEKAQILNLIARLAAVPGLESALEAVRKLPPARYTGDDWHIVRSCFTLFRHAAAELQVVFAEAASVDFIEVAQIAQKALRGPDGLPTEAAIALADGIRHLLVDEFQDTSRRQHQLLACLIAGWPDRDGRSCFLVGDPMQSIYFFRDADAELFSRVKTLGLEIPNGDPLLFDFVTLGANFRTTPLLVERLNDVFLQVFAVSDGSGVSFSPSKPARAAQCESAVTFKLYLNFSPQPVSGKPLIKNSPETEEDAHTAQTKQIVDLIKSHLGRLEQARIRANAEKGSEKYRIAVLGRTRAALTPVAVALREEGIPFRALDLEPLKDRPEVLDALALARALLNPQDRVAWLGVLRAPWCGLSLEDLHRLTSADDPALLVRPVPHLLAERLNLLSEAGRSAGLRVLDALAWEKAIRAAQPALSPGTRLEQIWLRLGGPACVDAAARANVDLLWSCLDSLPGGDEDLLGPSLDAALDELTALPDPLANSDFGVQLMTIHKSKGLEFEVVIVPDLQAATALGSRKLLSWLERGLSGSAGSTEAGSGEITEFLIAPLQSKGTDRGNSKAWVDRVYQERESQEMRRILYVAATRAREELHLFARPAYKVQTGGSLSLVEPGRSLLATAWPALEEEVRACFEGWKAASSASEARMESSAAAIESTLAEIPSPIRPTRLLRLPPGYHRGISVLPRSPAESAEGGEAQTVAPSSEIGASSPHASVAGVKASFTRHEGGVISRVVGTAVHAFLERLSILRTEHDWESARGALTEFEPAVAATIRAAGIDQSKSSGLAAQALQMALKASHSAEGQWILSPHVNSASETRWTGIVSGGLRTVRVDRVFRAGVAPGIEGDDAWWIIDYKTAHAGDRDHDSASALPELRRIFAPQLEAYTRVLRNMSGQDTVVRAGLYYPRLLLLDWWEI